jgi:hypothetical protein
VTEGPISGPWIDAAAVSISRLSSRERRDILTSLSEAAQAPCDLESRKTAGKLLLLP